MGGKGGDVTIRAGHGYNGAENGNICFTLPDGTELIRIAGDGAFYVKGEKCTSDIELYLAMRLFFLQSIAAVGEERESSTCGAAMDGSNVVCFLPEGHDGRHRDGSLSWPKEQE